MAWCPDLDIASQGKTIEESLENLKEAIELYLEDEEATIPKKEAHTHRNHSERQNTWQNPQRPNP